ncbi:hypothetical protein HKX48_005236 [Thoreauomyces humboldtii]|nr:hypothetical protein HKX48_005236 [Thoreauomyces humboldtii]
MAEVAKEPTASPVPDHPGFAWTPEIETHLFDAVIKFRPLGVHKHFRIVSVQRHLRSHTGNLVPVPELWAHLSHYYDLAALDAMADETDDDITFEARKKRAGYPFKVVAEFSLPADEFEDMIGETRKAVAASPAPDEAPAVGSGSGAEEDAPPGRRAVGRPRKQTKKEMAAQAAAASTEPAIRRTRAASTAQAATPTTANKRPRRNA